MDDIYATEHFIRRAGERLGYSRAEAVALAGRLIRGAASGAGGVEFVARVSKDGRRLFRFQAIDAEHYYALVDTESDRCITVMPSGFTVPRQNKGHLKL